MAEYEKDKFIVINRKRIEELQDAIPCAGVTGLMTPDDIAGLYDGLNNFFKSYVANLGPLDQKYYVCNQDEPYAQKVIDVILEGEREKERKACNKAVRKRHS